MIGSLFLKIRACGCLLLRLSSVIELVVYTSINGT